MATIPTKPTIDVDARRGVSRVPSWPLGRNAYAPERTASAEGASRDAQELRPSGGDALQALLAFSALHQQVRQRRALASRHHGFETLARGREVEAGEPF